MTNTPNTDLAFRTIGIDSATPIGKSRSLNRPEFHIPREKNGAHRLMHALIPESPCFGYATCRWHKIIPNRVCLPPGLNLQVKATCKTVRIVFECACADRCGIHTPPPNCTNYNDRRIIITALALSLAVERS